MFDIQNIEKHLRTQERTVAAVQVSLAAACLRAVHRAAVKRLVLLMVMNGMPASCIIMQQPGPFWVIAGSVLILHNLFHAVQAARQLVITGRLVYSEKLPPQLQCISILQAIAQLRPLAGQAGKRHLARAASFVQPAKNV